MIGGSTANLREAFARRRWGTPFPCTCRPWSRPLTLRDVQPSSRAPSGTRQDHRWSV